MHRIHDGLCQLLIVSCLAFSVSSFAKPGLQSPQVQANPSDGLIKLNVLVTDTQNRPIMDVKKEEFRVLENGSVQTISYFSVDELPLDYCIVLDTSGSLKKSSDQVIDAAQTIVRNNKPGDETALIEFKDQPELLQGFTATKGTILQVLDFMRKRASRQSAVIDAIYLAAQYVAEYNPVDHLSRRAIIVISDGVDNDSYYRLDELRKILRQKNVQVFAIGYDMSEVAKASGKETQRRAMNLLTEIAKETGGQAYFPKSNVELQEIASLVLQTLRSEYVIGYTPNSKASKGSFHKVTVSAFDVPGRDKRTTITRAGYIDEGKK